MVTGTHIGLVTGSSLRIEDPIDRLALSGLLAEGSDGVLADGVMDVIDTAYPDHLPDGEVLVIGIAHVGCLPPSAVSLARADDGDVVFDAVADGREMTTECEAPQYTVAIAAASEHDVPPGSTDGADVVAFQRVVPPAVPDAVTAFELDGTDDAEGLAHLVPPGSGALPQLPSLRPGVRRFAFVRGGCGATSAELIVTSSRADARLVETIPVECSEQEYYLAVFDVAGIIGLVLQLNPDIAVPHVDGDESSTDPSMPTLEMPAPVTVAELEEFRSMAFEVSAFGPDSPVIVEVDYLRASSLEEVVGGVSDIVVGTVTSVSVPEPEQVAEGLYDADVTLQISVTDSESQSAAPIGYVHLGAVADSLGAARAAQLALADLVPLGVNGIFVVRAEFPAGVLLPVALESTDGRGVAFRESMDAAVGEMSASELFEALKLTPRECGAGPCIGD